MTFARTERILKLMPKLNETITFDLGTARTDTEIKIAGSSLVVETITGNATLKFNEIENNPLNLNTLQEFETPFQRLYLNNAAQPGCTLVFTVLRCDFRAKPFKIIGGRTYYVIAASDAPAIWKSQADIVCTGTSLSYIDDVIIQAATTKYTNVLLSPGNFWFGTAVNGVTGHKIKGSGKWGTTIINCQLNLASAFVFNAKTDWEISDMQFWSNNANCGLTNGIIYVHTNSQRWVIRDLYFYYLGDATICINIDNISQSTPNYHIKDCVFSLTGYGVKIGNSASASYVKIENCNFYNMKYIGVSTNYTSATQVKNCHFYNCGVNDYGAISIGANSGFVSVTGSYIAHTGNSGAKATGYGIKIINGARGTIIDTCYIVSNGGQGVWSQAADSTSITNCYFGSNGYLITGTTAQRSNIEVDNVAGTFLISNNTFGGVDVDRPLQHIHSNGAANLSVVNSIISYPAYARTFYNPVVSPVKSTFSNNQNYIAPGETRTYSGSLTAGNANAFAFAWQNPEAQKVLVTKVRIEVATPGGTGSSVLDVGTGATATTHNDNFLDGVDLNSAAIYDSMNSTDKGTNGVMKPVLVDENGGTTDYVTGQILVANAASLVGKYYIEVIGR